MRKISRKNYIVFSAISIVTLVLLLIFIEQVKNVNILKKSVMSDILNEIIDDDFTKNLKSYSVDNPNFILYISNNVRFDEEFKQYIVSSDLNDKIVYYSGWNILSTNFASEFKNNFFDYSIKNVPLSALKQSNLYLFEGGKVKNLLYYGKEKIRISEVKEYLESFGEKSND